MQFTNFIQESSDGYGIFFNSFGYPLMLIARNKVCIYPNRVVKITIESTGGMLCRVTRYRCAVITYSFSSIGIFRGNAPRQWKR